MRWNSNYFAQSEGERTDVAVTFTIHRNLCRFGLNRFVQRGKMKASD
jgi:hypothetical protein